MVNSSLMAVLLMRSSYVRQESTPVIGDARSMDGGFPRGEIEEAISVAEGKTGDEVQGADELNSLSQRRVVNLLFRK